MGDERVGADRRFGGDRHARCWRSGGWTPAGDAKRGAEPGQHAGGDGVGLARFAQVLERHDEFVAANTGNDVSRAQAGAQALRPSDG